MHYLQFLSEVDLERNSENATSMLQRTSWNTLFSISELQFPKQTASHAHLCCLGLTFTALRLPLKKFFTSFAPGNKLFKIPRDYKMLCKCSSLVPFRSFRVSNHAICRFWWSEYATVRGSYEWSRCPLGALIKDTGWNQQWHKYTNHTMVLTQVVLKCFFYFK